MRESTQCPKCQVVLNLPEGAMGRRLKCPKCNEKFVAHASPDSAGSPISSTSIARYDSSENLPISSGDGSLRELFDLASLATGERDAAQTPQGPAQADAAGLFLADAEPPRRTGLGDQRSKPRPCTACGNVIPAGMSLCSMCGMDIDTGEQVDLGIDDMIDLPVQPRREPTPMSVLLIGTLGALTSIALLVLCLAFVSQSSGFLFLALVCAFGVFGSVQFLRGKSVRLLIAALTMYAIFGFLILIAMPIYDLYVNPSVTNVDNPSDFEAPSIQIQSAAESIDQDKMVGGIVILLAYAGVSFFLLQNRTIRRHFHGHSSSD